jgi:hypothetical protein
MVPGTKFLDKFLSKKECLTPLIIAHSSLRKRFPAGFAVKIKSGGVEKTRFKE